MICFDLEGPLSPQDNAYKVMKLVKNGGTVFEALSEYDDVLALKNKAGYEPGDTLKLIVPFLNYYGISESDIKRVSEKALLVRGMKKTIEWLKERDVPVRIISTSYEQHAHTIGRRLGVSKADIASTRLNLGDMHFDRSMIELLGVVEKAILSNGLSEKTMVLLDDLYFERGLFNEIPVSVVGGQRKVEALLAFAEKEGVSLSKVAAVGDSITDYKMLREVSGKGGLAIAFNANQYCLPYADVAVATLDGTALLPLFQAFLSGGRKEAMQRVKMLQQDVGLLEKDYGYLLELDVPPRYSVVQKDMEDVLTFHREMRMMVRGEAGKLG